MKTLFLFAALSVSALQTDSNSMQMLTKASRLGDLKAAETLLSSGMDPNLLNEYGRTPLYYAVLFNRADVAALLLDYHADPNTRASSDDPSGGDVPQTPLQIAASMGNLRIASLLITAGAHVDAKAVTGRTALHFAVVESHLDMIRLLIQKGADVNARDANGASPLDDAVWQGHLDATAILLANGARLNEVETKTGATPINEAAYRGQTQIVRYLLKLIPNLELADNRGYTPLENAIRMGNADPAVLLLEAQGMQQMTGELFGKIMSAATKKDMSVVVEALFRCRASANDLLPSGATLLDAAASAGALEVVRALLNHNADPNKIGRNGTSPLEDASLRGFAAIVEMLLDHGASVNEVNSGSGTTALYAAASFGKKDVVSLLLRRGADVNLCGNGHTTPYKAALENAQKEIALQIQRSGGLNACRPQ